MKKDLKPIKKLKKVAEKSAEEKKKEVAEKMCSDENK